MEGIQPRRESRRPAELGHTRSVFRDGSDFTRKLLLYGGVRLCVCAGTRTRLCYLRGLIGILEIQFRRVL